jgi:hypothetical protein
MKRPRSRRYDLHLRERRGIERSGAIVPKERESVRPLRAAEERYAEMRARWKGKKPMLALIALLGLILAMAQLAEEALRPLMTLWRLLITALRER